MTNDMNGIPSDTPTSVARPGVIIWYYVYCAVMIALGMLAIWMGVSMIQHPAQFMPQPGTAAPSPPTPDMIRNTGIGTLAIGAVVVPLCIAAFFVPRKPWAWAYHLVILCLGVVACWTLVFSIPLLVFWMKPETKAYFGRE